MFHWFLVYVEVLQLCAELSVLTIRLRLIFFAACDVTVCDVNVTSSSFQPMTDPCMPYIYINIYGNIYHQYTPNVSIYTIHGSYGLWLNTWVPYMIWGSPYDKIRRFHRWQEPWEARQTNRAACDRRLPSGECEVLGAKVKMFSSGLPITDKKDIKKTRGNLGSQLIITCLIY